MQQSFLNCTELSFLSTTSPGGFIKRCIKKDLHFKKYTMNLTGCIVSYHEFLVMPGQETDDLGLC